MAGDITDDVSAEPEAGTETGSEDSPELRQGCLTRLIPVTTPGCASCLTTVFLIITVGSAWALFWSDTDHIPWRQAMNWWRITGVVVLTIVIPIVVYKLIQLWLEGERSPFPDLDYAWHSGLHALSSNGISLTSTPIYLLLGSNGEQQERALIAASGRRMRVEGVPQGPSPLHWYANPDGIYIFCSDACWTSALASLREELVSEAAAAGIQVSEAAVATPIYPTEPPRAPPAAPAAPGPADDNSASGSDIRGTMTLDHYLVQQENPQALSTPRPVVIRTETVDLDDGFTVAQPDTAALAPTDPVPIRLDSTSPATPSEPVLVSPQYSAASLQELQYLCQLLRRSRQPVCGVNGVVSLIQFESIHSTPTETEELQKAIKADLSTVTYALQLKSPVTALIVGLEKERGFGELVRRVGRDRTATQRFGRKFDLHAIPTEKDLAGLSVHVCGAFEDWAYALFREEDSLKRPGNTRLYELLSKVRCSWKARLGELLKGGFGCEEHGASDSLLFSGCYFAATGETPDRQAFVKSVFDKLADEQELVEWTPQALASHRRQGILAAIGMVASLLLLIVLGAMYFFG